MRQFNQLVLVVLGVSHNALWADGKYFPEKASKKAPSIPRQRAVLAWKDGMETLIIESALDGEGQEFGWIIPLPAEPCTIEQASTGFLDTLSLNLQPKITHDLSERLKTTVRISILLTQTDRW